MNNIKYAAEDLVLSFITKIRDIVMPIFSKYTAYYKYIEIFLYTSYAIILLGFYNTIPEYIPVLRNAILYIAVLILLLRFNTISWTNPKFAILGGNKFSEFDRRLIISTCIFILLTHIVSETATNYAKDRLKKDVIQPVSTRIIQPIYNYIDTSGAVNRIPTVKNSLQDQGRPGVALPTQ